MRHFTSIHSFFDGKRGCRIFSGFFIGNIEDFLHRFKQFYYLKSRKKKYFTTQSTSAFSKTLKTPNYFLPLVYMRYGLRLKSVYVYNHRPGPAILLFAKKAEYENEKCPKIKVFVCILHSKLKKGYPFFNVHSPPLTIERQIFFGQRHMHLQLFSDSTDGNTSTRYKRFPPCHLTLCGGELRSVVLVWPSHSVH